MPRQQRALYNTTTQQRPPKEPLKLDAGGFLVGGAGFEPATPAV